MLNQFVLIGRIEKLPTSESDVIVIESDNSVTECVSTFPVHLPVIVKNSIVEISEIGDVIGLKGRLDYENNEVMLIAEKVSILTQGKNLEDERYN